MDLELLKARLHIDRVSAWRELGCLLEESKLERGHSGRDLTSEYYIALISRIVEELRIKGPRDSKEVQTDGDVSLGDENEGGKMKNKEDVIKYGETKDSEGVLESGEVKGGGEGECEKKADEFWLGAETNLVKGMKNQGYEACFREYLETLEKRGGSRKKTTIRELTDELYNRHMRKQKDEDVKKRNKDREEEVSRLKKEIEELKEQNENLKIRISICQEELAKWMYHEEASG